MQKARGSFAALRHDGTVVSWGIPRSGGDSSEVQDQYLVLQQQLGPTVSLPVFTFPGTNSSPLKIVWDPKGNVIFKSLIFMGELLVSGRVPHKSDQFQKDSKDCFVLCLHSSFIYVQVLYDRCREYRTGMNLFSRQIMQDQVYAQNELYTLLGTNISPEKPILKMVFLFPRWDMLIPQRVYHSALIFASTKGVYHGRQYKLVVDVVMSIGVTGTLQACQCVEFHHGNFPCFIRYTFGSTPPPGNSGSTMYLFVWRGQFQPSLSTMTGVYAIKMMHSLDVYIIGIFFWFLLVSNSLYEI